LDGSNAFVFSLYLSSPFSIDRSVSSKRSHHHHRFVDSRWFDLFCDGIFAVMIDDESVAMSHRLSHLKIQHGVQYSTSKRWSDHGE